MNIILRKVDKTYGGYDYVEFNPELNKYQTGNTRGHRGHFAGGYMSIEVATKKELKQAELKCEEMGYRNYTY